MLSERDCWTVLASVVGLGPRTLALLLAEHGSGRRVVELAATGSGRRLIRDGPARDRDRLPTPMIEALGTAVAAAPDLLARLRDLEIGVITVDDETYPRRLRELAEPPLVLFVRGDPTSLAGRHALAIVGTRRATEPGRRIAARIADQVTRLGSVVVSGLAVGIDGAAHAAAVIAGGPTVAVLGSGHDRLFPRAHARLAMDIVAGGGAVVSELPPDARPTTGTFPRRNRLISGLADATVVVEAAPRSGALITARWALEQGKDCFIVPGSIDAPASAGCLAFLREFAGEARIVAGVAELVDDLGLVRPGTAEPLRSGAVSLEAALAVLGGVEIQVAAALIDGLTTADELATRTRLPVATVLGTLTILEMRGFVASVYGRFRPAGALAAAPPGFALDRRPMLPLGAIVKPATPDDQTAARSR
jgi:DNA processing protein